MLFSSRALQEEWMKAWPEALNVWSKFTRLRPPTLCLTTDEAVEEGLTESFAMIRLTDQSVVVSLPQVASCHLQPYAVEVLAHEIGHHVLSPATLTDHARMIARMRWALPTLEQHAGMISNLYSDLLINDRLQRSAGLRMADIYRALGNGAKSGSVWTLYMRIYEILWSLERGSLGGNKPNDRIEGDAWLGARLVRSYARDWLDGAGRFAALFLPHLLEDRKSAHLLQKLMDTEHAAAGGYPSGLIDEEAGEREGAIHPALDPTLSDLPLEESESADSNGATPADAQQNTRSQRQAREPFQFGEILRSAGLNISDHDAAVRYYQERARPYLIPFPSKEAPESTDSLPEGLEPWDIGDALDAADWMQTIIQSPHVIPGVTTVQRVWGTSPGREPKRQPLDLDLYVDSSGSMPNPQRITSYPALAGAILCLSALRAGARVHATLWSGKSQFTSTPGFVRDADTVIRVLTGYFGGGTTFPIHELRDTYLKRKKTDHPAHILVISDDGVSTMFDQDEQGSSGFDISREALEKAGGGGTLVLNLPEAWDTYTGPYTAIKRARDEQGWRVYRVSTLEELIEFAREFSRLRYGSASRKLQETRREQ